MKLHISKLTSLARVALAGAALATGSSAAASAQSSPPADLPSYATPGVAATPAGPLPSYATPAVGEQIRGRISAITGKYTLQVHDQRGYIDNVTLHQGTVINPTGLTLRAGMQVTITGTTAGSTFAANQIDTPYTVTLVQPVYPFYGAGFGWGAGWGGWGPAWGGWGYGWGPRYGFW